MFLRPRIQCAMSPATSDTPSVDCCHRQKLSSSSSSPLLLPPSGASSSLTAKDAKVFAADLRESGRGVGGGAVEWETSRGGRRRDRHLHLRRHPRLHRSSVAPYVSQAPSNSPSARAPSKSQAPSSVTSSPKAAHRATVPRQHIVLL